MFMLLALVESSTDSSVTVAEISSFQLETIQDFHPEIGVLLNLSARPSRPAQILRIVRGGQNAPV